MKLRKRIKEAIEACESLRLEAAMEFVDDSSSQHYQLEAYGFDRAVCELEALLDDPKTAPSQKSS